MKVQVRRGFVEINNNFYFSPKLCRLEGACVEVSVWRDDESDVYVDGEFYCEAVCEEKNTASPMRYADKGRLERMALKRTCQSGVYGSMDDFPPVPDGYRCETAVGSEDALQCEVSRTARAFRRLSQPVKVGQDKLDVKSALVNIRDGLDALINYLDTEAQGEN